MIAKFITIAGLILLFLGGALLILPWKLILATWNIRHKKYLRALAIKQAREGTHRVISPILGPLNYLKVSRSFGAVHGVKGAAKVLDELHQLDRRTSALTPYSVRDEHGFLSENRIIKSYADLIARNVEIIEGEDRDLRPLSIGLLSVGTIASIAGVLLG